MGPPRPVEGEMRHPRSLVIVTAAVVSTLIGGVVAFPAVAHTVGRTDPGSVSGPDLAATVEVPVEPATPSPTGSATGLTQLVAIPVGAGGISASPTGATVTLVRTGSGDGGPRYEGNLPAVTVINATGTDAGWVLEARADTTGSTIGRAGGGRGLTWANVAAVAHAVVPGDTARVSPAGRSEQRSRVTEAWVRLCSAPAHHSGGTFRCSSHLSLVLEGEAAGGTLTVDVTLRMMRST